MAKNLRVAVEIRVIRERVAFVVHAEKSSAQRRGVSTPRARVRHTAAADTYETRTGIPRSDAAMFLAHRSLAAHLKLQWIPTAHDRHDCLIRIQNEMFPIFCIHFHVDPVSYRGTKVNVSHWSLFGRVRRATKPVP